MTDDRTRREAEFHDHLYAHGKGSREAARKYYSIFAECRSDYLAKILEDARGTRVLEYGCGPGWYAVKLSKRGAEVTAIDISTEAISRARAALPKKAEIELLEMNAESLEFGDKSFDMVCGTGILHHLELDRSFREIHRVLKPGGRALFIEPLGHNAAINLYRRFTPEMRSVDEHPLRMADFDAARRIFATVDLTFYNLLTLLAVPLRSRQAFGRVVAGLARADRAIVDKAPFLGRYAWNVLIEFGKAPA